MSHSKTLIRLYPEVVAARFFTLVEEILKQFGLHNVPGAMAVDVLSALKGVPDMGLDDDNVAFVTFRPKPRPAVITGHTWTEAMKLPPLRIAMELAKVNGYQLHFHWTLGLDWKNTTFERIADVAHCKGNPFQNNELMGGAQLELLQIVFRPLTLPAAQVNTETITLIDIYLQEEE